MTAPHDAPAPPPRIPPVAHRMVRVAVDGDAVSTFVCIQDAIAHLARLWSLEIAELRAAEIDQKPPSRDERFVSLQLAAEIDCDPRNALRALRHGPQVLPKKLQVRWPRALANVVNRYGKRLTSGDDFFRLPIWREIERALERGLSGHPDAAKAVAAELRRTKVTK